ncbi:MAG: NAD(P)H-binding protein [Gemmatimonadota bacterium]|nr:NAD(P)H-binding protein [Gemmatimonadota bacterium]
MADLFVTGVTGVVGRALAPELAFRGTEAATLVRDGDASLPPNIEVVPGDLGDAAPWTDALRGARTVLHLAAATGARDAAAFQRVNVDGTRTLLEACVEAGVSRFIFVSSIAAGFDDLDEYPYGASKRDAETLVRFSGLDHAIVRPTVVLGPGAPILERFVQLASLPWPVLPGSGDARIQPIDARDLARCLLDLADGPALDAETIEVGGPQVVTLEEFLRQVRRTLGKRESSVVHVPLGAVRAGLRAARSLTGGRFPLTPAQVAMFEQDGVADPHPFVDERRETFSDVMAALQWCFAESGTRTAARLPAP